MPQPKHHQLSLTELALSCHLGWPDAERANKQTVLVSMDLRFKTMPLGCKSDALDGTVCYDQLAQRITRTCEMKTYRLIEHLAYDIYQIIKNLDNSLSCVVTVSKQPPIDNLQGEAYYRCGDWV